MHMKFKLQQHVDLSQLTTMKIGGSTRYFTELTDPNQLKDVFVWLDQQKLPHLILSGGSNTVFDDSEYVGLVIKLSFLGKNVVEQKDNSVTLRVDAGEVWDNLVSYTVNHGWAGLEALSGIPGLCGAAPVQNIGAYGQEISNVISSVEAYDTNTDTLVELNNSSCKFGYRDSIFKSSQKGRYIITSITLQLSTQPPSIPEYEDVRRYLLEHNISQPTLSELRDAILEIRKTKFADPKTIPNSGSFFGNPIVSSSKAAQLKQDFPNIRMFEQEDYTYKVYAGWLIESLGLKGKNFGSIRVDPSHALVLENPSNATRKQLDQAILEIQQAVMSKYGIELEPEPELIQFSQ